MLYSANAHKESNHDPEYYITGCVERARLLSEKLESMSSGATVKSKCLYDICIEMLKTNDRARNQIESVDRNN
ncbi:hypothetical protein PHET_10417 [Paragonimus heterotremus]|uniref:Uncharacterized protein n=1 Tax=Paragonimus heterotremus TaxID=100268 RepID=A0A8J4T227_9TREM|nr:hypothetical protein PHET_10417 [Paragonimus heterotremus]